MAKNSLAICVLLMLGFHAGASDKIEFPEEELATESVLPVFENAKSVLNRNVLTEGRFEIGGGAGFSLNEPFYNPMNYGVTASYHFDELHAVNFTGTFWADGLSSYGEQLANGEGLDDGQTFDTSYAPHPESMFLANYQLTVFYGKISITKRRVMNLTLHGLAGLGMIQMEGASPIAANIGFGQRFYFTPRFAFRMDLSLFMYNGPDPTSQSLDSKDPAFVAPAASDYEDRIYYNTLLQGYLVFLL